MLQPARNKIVFQGQPTEKVINLCNQTLRQYLLTNTFLDETYCLQSIGDKIYYGDRDVDETIQGVSITRSLHSFHQNDDNIRTELYRILFPILEKKYRRVILIGGECYAFAALVNAEVVDCYSDYPSIVADCQKNKNRYGAVINSYLVDYGSKQSFDNHLSRQDYELCILNVSKSGLGKNFTDIVKEMRTTTYYISCNEKSFLKDGLPVVDRWNIRNEHYGITLYSCY